METERDQNEILGELPKNAQETIRILLSRYRGHEFINVRTFRESEGKWLPTRKGICFNEEVLGLMIRLLKQAQRKLKRTARGKEGRQR